MKTGDFIIMQRPDGKLLPAYVVEASAEQVLARAFAVSHDIVLVQPDKCVTFADAYENADEKAARAATLEDAIQLVAELTKENARLTELLTVPGAGTSPPAMPEKPEVFIALHGETAPAPSGESAPAAEPSSVTP